MKKIVTSLAVCGLVALRFSAAVAVCNGGGNNETSEQIIGPTWALRTTPDPGVVPGGLASGDLLITEVAYSGNSQEFIEIYNPLPFPVDLSRYYLTDEFGAAGGYYNIVTGAGYTIPNTVDYNVSFPAGTAPIAPGEVIVVWAGAAAGAPFGYGLPGGTRLFQIAGPAVGGATLMVPHGNTPSNANGQMTNGGEFVMLYWWDGACDLVCDVDYFAWGANGSATNPRADKSGRSADGPDGDASPSAYLNDTSDAAQGAGLTHLGGQSLARTTVGAHAANGNGCISGPTPTQSSTWGQVKVRYR